MQVPCSMPLAEPWSPVGYQVVQLPEVDVVAPAAGKPPEVSVLPKSALPRSPVGYRVVLVGEDRVPAAPPRKTESGALATRASAAHPAGKRPAQRQRPKSNGMAIWLPLVVVAAIGVPISLATAIAASQRRAAQPPANALAQPGVVFVALPQNQQEQHAGDAAAGDAAVAVPRALALEAERADECAECAGPDAANNPGDREFFGTAVGFVRNPVEAARLASAERKLTFVLHVSGNFDDPGFT